MRAEVALIINMLVTSSQSIFLIPCWPVSVQRLDPIVSPGKVGAHVHQIAGGGAFSPWTTHNLTQDANCTTCFVQGDKSNYWIPRLYYHAANGSFEGVDQVGSASMYYLNKASQLGSDEQMHGFPAGLQMVAGDPFRRAQGSTFADEAIAYTCLDYSGVPTHHRGFPDKHCPDGIRAEITFPSCWDGHNLNSSDHKSHMAYPTGTIEAGPCPPSHPVHLVTLKTEWIFDTQSYRDRWYSDSQPFVWSTGDPTGFGLHADFLMGWDPNLLNSAVAECHSPFGELDECSPFQGLLPPEKQYVNPQSCAVAPFVNDTIYGEINQLPGCNSVQPGPETARRQVCLDYATLVPSQTTSRRKRAI